MIVLSSTDLFRLTNAMAVKATDAESDPDITDEDKAAYDRLVSALQKMLEDTYGGGLVLLQKIPAPLNGL